MRHYLTLERFTHSDQTHATCECGWQSTDVTPGLAELKGLAHIRAEAPPSHGLAQPHTEPADMVSLWHSNNQQTGTPPTPDLPLQIATAQRESEVR
jgi:hypothetical protein